MERRRVFKFLSYALSHLLDSVEEISSGDVLSKTFYARLFRTLDVGLAC